MAAFYFFQMTELDDIKANIPILEIAQRLGIKVKRNKALCFSGHDTEPSLTFYPKTNTFHCFGCRAGSSNIDLVMQAGNMDFKEALNWIKADFNLISEKGTRKSAHFKHTKPLRNNLDTSQLKYGCQSSLYADIYSLIPEIGLTDQGREYLKGRGINLKTASDFRLVSSDNPADLKRALLAYHSREELTSAGFYNSKGNFVFWQPGILIPFCQGENIIYWQMRTYKGKPKYLNLAAPKPIWNIDALRKLPFDTEIALFEGVIDALSSYQLLPNLPALAVIGQMKAADIAQHLVNYTVLFGNDKDRQGETFLQEVKAEFTARGGQVKPYPIDYSGCTDLNEYLQGVKNEN